MNAFALSLELARQQSRTRKVTGISLLIHALLLLLLLLHRTMAPEPEVLTEITWVEPEPVRPAAAAASIEPSRPVRRISASRNSPMNGCSLWRLTFFISDMSSSTERLSRMLPSPRMRARIAGLLIVLNGASASTAIDLGSPCWPIARSRWWIGWSCVEE